MPACDTTVYQNNCNRWMFTSVSEPVYAGDQMLLLSALSLERPDEFHWDTPVSADPRLARYRGRVIQNETGMYRLAQDGQGNGKTPEPADVRR